MRKQQAVQEQDVQNSALLNVITPVGLEFQKNSLSIGENLGKVYGLIRYPQKVEVEWLSKITNIPATIVSIGFKPVDNATMWYSSGGMPRAPKTHFLDKGRKRPPRTAKKSLCRLTGRAKPWG